MGKLDGRVAIVTGGGAGIGKTIALSLAKEGADVVVCGRHLDVLEAVAAEIKSLGRCSLAMTADVSVKDQVQSMAQRTLDEMGKIDILVNNAATILRAPLLEMTEEAWDNVVDVNLKGTFLCIQAVAKHMIDRKYGKIINISSIGGRGGSEDAGANYNSAKAGVIQLTKSAAFELGPYGINVNSVSPGTIMAGITQRPPEGESYEHFVERKASLTVLHRSGVPEDIANAVVFLASDDSSFISGQTIPVDGGRNNRM